MILANFHGIAGAQDDGAFELPSGGWLASTTVCVGVNNLTDEVPSLTGTPLIVGSEGSNSALHGRTWHVVFGGGSELGLRLITRLSLKRAPLVSV